MTVEVEKPAVLDILDTKTPALSSTNDMPVVETKPDASNEGTPPKKPNESEVVAAPDEGKTQEESATSPEEPSASDEPKKAKGVQKRLDELTRQREDERRRAEAAEARLDRALKALEPRAPVQEPKEDSEDPEPVKPAKTEDQDAYATALEEYISKKAAWISRREVKTVLAEQERKTSEKQIQDAQVAAQTAYRGRIEKAAEKYPDYHAVAESPDVAVSIPMAHAILHHEQGPDIAYYLGKNPQDAQRISTLAPPVQLVELGLIVAKLSAAPAAPAPVKPAVSHAPKPIEPLKGNSEKGAKSPEDESMEEYAARRKKELNAIRPGVRH